MTAADPRRDRLNRIASACPQCAGYKPQRSEAASTNELHTAIAAAEDVVDPRSAGSDFQPDHVPQGVMESIAAMGAEQDRRNAAVARVTTPGPWKYEPSSQTRYSFIVLTEDFDEDANRGTVLCRMSDGLNEADARLIAAAPDLLAACRMARQLEVLRDTISENIARTREPRATVEYLKVAKENVASARSQITAIRRQIDAAVAKATGGAE